MEASANIRVAFSAAAKSFEALSSLGLLGRIELEDEVSNFLISTSNCQVDSGVGRVGVAEQGEATLSEAEELF